MYPTSCLRCSRMLAYFCSSAWSTVRKSSVATGRHQLYAVSIFDDVSQNHFFFRVCC